MKAMGILQMNRANQLPWYSDIQKSMNTVSQHYSLGNEKHLMLYKCLQLLPDNPNIVELGVCHGATAIMLADVANTLEGTYTGIDNWSLEGSREEVQQAFDKLGLVGDHIRLIQGSTHDPALAQEYGKYDFLLIDAGHDEANVRYDIWEWISKRTTGDTKEGTLVAFDDYPASVSKQDPHWAVREYADRATEHWDLIAYWNGLMVRQYNG